MLLGPGQGRPVDGLGFGQDGADAPHPIEHLDEVGPVGKQMGHQQDAEIPEASLLGEMAKNRCSDPDCATVASLACRESGQTEPGIAGFCVCPDN